MLKTASGRDMWNLPLSTKDSNSGAKVRKNDLLKSQSERWGQKVDSSSPKNPRHKFQRAQSEKMHVVSTETASFDWNSFRKQRVGTMKRSKSDLSSIGKAEYLGGAGEDRIRKEGKETEHSTKKEMRRCVSEKWQKTSRVTAESPMEASQTVESFDWKSWRKDKRRTMKKSNSDRPLCKPQRGSNRNLSKSVHN